MIEISIKEAIDYSRRKTKECLELLENMPYDLRCSRKVKNEIIAMSDKGYRIRKTNPTEAVIECPYDNLIYEYGKRYRRIEIIPVISVGVTNTSKINH